MLSNKNKNKSFVFEEEYDQNKNLIKSRQESLSDSLEIKPKDIIIRVEGEDYKFEKEIPGLNSYIKEIKSYYDIKQKVYILPKSIDKHNFEIFYSFINSNSKVLNKLDLGVCKKIVDLSFIFKALSVIKNIISDYIMPSLEKNTCLRIIKDYINYIYDENSKNLFLELIQASIDVASNNIYYLISNMNDDLFSISEDSLEEIIERYFESVIYQSNLDHSLIMRLMMKNRKINNIYELLENERKRSINIFEKLYHDGLEPTIIWKIKSEDPKQGYYKESEEFQYEKINIVLINYYDANNDVYNMALRLTDIRDENIDNSQQHVISILSICEINEIKFKSKINFNCIFSNTKTKVLVTKIESFSKYFEKFDGLDYSLTIYFNISYNFSSILTHICKNFYEFHSLSSIAKLSKNVLNIILKNNVLNVRTEDEVLFAVINWINNRHHVQPDVIEDLIKNINWRSISLDGLLDFILSESKLLLNSQELQNIIISEFSYRFKEEYDVEIINKKKSKLSFTSELILKLIKIASRYEPTYKSSVPTNQSNINNIKISNNTSRNNNFIDDSKYPSIIQAVNTSPDTSVNKKPSVTPPSDNDDKLNSKYPYPVQRSLNIKNKVYEFNIIAQSRLEKSGYLKDGFQSSDNFYFNRYKTPNNRIIKRDNSENTSVGKVKSKSITNEKKNNSVSKNKINSSVIKNKVLFNNKKNNTNEILKSKENTVSSNKNTLLSFINLKNISTTRKIEVKTVKKDIINRPKSMNILRSNITQNHLFS